MKFSPGLLVAKGRRRLSHRLLGTQTESTRLRPSSSGLVTRIERLYCRRPRCPFFFSVSSAHKSVSAPQDIDYRFGMIVEQDQIISIQIEFAVGRQRTDLLIGDVVYRVEVARVV